MISSFHFVVFSLVFSCWIVLFGKSSPLCEMNNGRFLLFLLLLPPLFMFNLKFQPGLWRSSENVEQWTWSAKGWRRKSEKWTKGPEQDHWARVKMVQDCYRKVIVVECASLWEDTWNMKTCLENQGPSTKSVCLYERMNIGSTQPESNKNANPSHSNNKKKEKNFLRVCAPGVQGSYVMMRKRERAWPILFPLLLGNHFEFVNGHHRGFSSQDSVQIRRLPSLELVSLIPVGFLFSRQFAFLLLMLLPLLPRRKLTSLFEILDLIQFVCASSFLRFLVNEWMAEWGIRIH